MLFVISLVFTFAMLFALTPWAKKFGLLDFPNPRKLHKKPTLLIGGLAMMMVLLLMLIASSNLKPSIYNSSKLWFLVGTLSAVVLAGLLDDYFRFNALRLLLIQSIPIILFIIFSGMSLQHLGRLFGSDVIILGGFAGVFTLISYLGVMNAVNMADGSDGAAGSTALIAFSWMGLFAYIESKPIQLLMCSVLTAGLITFLLFNMRFPWNRQARVFLGSAGSLSLGFLLTWSAINLTQGNNNNAYPISMVYVMALPLMDMFRVMLCRLINGVSPFEADQQHLHHRLLSLGCSANQVVLIKAFMSFLLGLIGFLGWFYQIPESFLFYGFLILLLIYCVMTTAGWRFLKTMLDLKHGGITHHDSGKSIQ